MFKIDPFKIPILNRAFKRDGLVLVGEYVWEHVREGRVIAEIPWKNIVVIQGNNHMFDVEFHGEVQVGDYILYRLTLFRGIR